MATNIKATQSKRAREMGQKDRVKERESRRNERKTRAEARSASGQVGPEMGEPEPVIIDEVDPDTLPAPTPGASQDTP